MTKGGQLLKLFTDEGIAGSLPFAEVRRQAFAMLDAARLDALAEYLATKARFDEKAFEWQHLDKAAQRIKLNLRPHSSGCPIAATAADDPLTAAELRHALQDCGCFGGPDVVQAHQLVQLGTGADATGVL